jgi:hypothetical protein
MNKRPTDAHLAEKILIREANLPAGDRVTVLALDSSGRAWLEIAARHKERKIRVVPLGAADSNRGITLKGDELRYLAGMDVNRFDAIDFDWPGVPFEPLQHLLGLTLKKRVEIFCTVAFGPFGGIPAGLLAEVGYTKKMVEKCPELFRKKGLPVFLEWLAIRGVDRVDLVSLKNGRWNQLHFSWGKA